MDENVKYVVMSVKSGNMWIENNDDSYLCWTGRSLTHVPCPTAGMIMQAFARRCSFDSEYTVTTWTDR